jgi:hypothetical protein
MTFNWYRLVPFNIIKATKYLVGYIKGSDKVSGDTEMAIPWPNVIKLFTVVSYDFSK